MEEGAANRNICLPLPSSGLGAPSSPIPACLTSAGTGLSLLRHALLKVCRSCFWLPPGW